MLRLPNLLIGWNPYPSATRRMDLRFIVCMIYSFVTMNIPFVLLYIFLGDVLLFSALGERQKQSEVMQNGQQGTSFLEPFKRLVHRRSPLTF